MLTAISYSSEFGGKVPLIMQLSLSNHCGATRSEEPQILNFSFEMLLQAMLVLGLQGVGKICFQVTAYYGNC